MAPTEHSRQQDRKTYQAQSELRWLIPLALILSIEFTWVVATWNPDLNEVLLRSIVLVTIAGRTLSNLFWAGDSRC
jgi:hypothetical protein